MKYRILTNKVSALIHRNKSLFFLLFNLIIGISLILLINIYYETNDDWYLSLISQGYFGDNTNQYMIYSNVVLGYILRPLYLITNTINWYVVIQLLLLTLSGYSIYRIVKNRSFLFSLSINLVFWLTVIFGSFNIVEFTKSAGIASIVGLFSIYHSCVYKDKQNLVLGFILSIFGFLYRNQSFLLTLPFIFVIIVFDYLRELKNNNVIIKKTVKTFALLVVIIASLFIVDRTHYQSDEWKEYTKFNDAIVEIFDYKNVPYNENEELYKQINYSRNDYYMVQQCLNDDVLKFNGDDLWQIINQTDSSLKIINIKKFIKFLIEYANVENTFVFIASITLLLIAFFDKNTRIQSLIITALEILILLYLYYKGRYPERVLNIIRACHIVSYIYLLTQTKNTNLNNQNINKVIVILLAISFCFTIFINKKVYTGDDVKFTDAIKNLNGRYVVDISYDNVEIQNQENPLLTTDIMDVNNCDYIYSWMAGAPIITNNRIEKGINISPYAQLINNEAYLVTKTEYHANLIEKYLQENYDVNVNKKYVDSIYCGEYTYLIYDYSLN